MLFLNDVGQVIREGFHHELLVVYEKHVFRDRDSLVAIVDGGGGVEELKALAVAFVLGWRIFNEGVLKEAVELTGANDFLGMIANAGDCSEDVLNSVAFHGRYTDKGSVFQEEELVTDMLFGVLDTGRFGSIGMIEIELVGDDQAGFLFLLNHAGDLTILRGDAFGKVDNQEANVSATD